MIKIFIFPVANLLKICYILQLLIRNVRNSNGAHAFRKTFSETGVYFKNALHIPTKVLSEFYVKVKERKHCMTPVINSVFTYLVVDFLCIAFSVFIIKKLTTDIGSELEIRMLKIMLRVFIVYSLVDAIWIVGEYGYMSFYIRIVNAVVCFFSIFLISVLSFFMFIYTEIRLKTAFMKKPELWIIASVPLVFSLFMCASSYYTGWIYYITPDNEYRRGPYYCWQMAVVFFYFVVALIRAMCCGAKDRMPMRRHATFSFVLAITVCFAIGSLQIFIPGTPLIVIAIFSH